MPEETHRYLIQYESTYTSAVEAGRQVEESVRRVGEAVTTTQTQLTGFQGPVTTTFDAMRTGAEGAGLAYEGLRGKIAGIGGSMEWQNRVMQRSTELMQIGIPQSRALSRAQSEVTRAMLESAGATEKAGHWLGGYIQRYLVRYFAVWQGMVAVQNIMRAVTEGHERMAESMYTLQIATSATDIEMQRYLSTLADVSAQTTTAPSALTGAAMVGGQIGPWAAQLAQITGAEPQEWIQHLTMLRDEYGLTANHIEGMLGRMAAAHANWTLQGMNYFGDWQQALRDTTTAVEDLAEAQRRAAAIRPIGIWERFGIGAERATMLGQQERLFGLRPEAERQRLLTEFAQTEAYRQVSGAIAATGGMGGPIEQWPQFQEWVARQPGLGPTTTAHEQWRLTGIAPGVQAGQFGMEGFAGRMTGAEAERYEELIQKWDAYFLEQGRYLEEQTITLVTEIGEPLKTIKGSAEASKLALEEMNERQRAAVYNWPGGAVLVTTPQALPSITAGGGPTGGGPAGSGGGGGGWQSQQFDMSNWQNIPQPQWSWWNIGGGQAPNMSTPSGPATGTVPMILKTQIDLNGKKVGEGTNIVLGDMYSQASKAAYGGGGAIATPY